MRAEAQGMPALPGQPPAASGPPGANALPSTPKERTKLLSNLYAYLATAEDEQRAAPVAAAIERLWLYTGSDTIAVLMDRSTKAVAVKELPLAQTLLDAVVDLAPDYAEGWNRRAYVHYLQGDLERMAGDLRRCLALEPNHFRAMEGLAQVMRETGQKAAALKAFKRLNEIHPNAQGVQEAIKDLSRDVEGQKT
jgi:tetratricopeptide (TPR) repeat protein